MTDIIVAMALLAKLAAMEPAEYRPDDRFTRRHAWTADMRRNGAGRVSAG